MGDVMKESAQISPVAFGSFCESGVYLTDNTCVTEGRSSSSRSMHWPRMLAPPKWIARMPTEVPARPSPGWSNRAHLPRMRTLLLIIPLATSVSHAQYVNTLTGRQFNNINAANADLLMSRIINDRLFQRRMTSMAQAQPDAAHQNAPAQPKYQFALSATDFRPEGKRDAPEQLAANAATPGERVQLTEMYRQIQQAIEASPDVRKNNLATAITILLGSSIQVVAQKKIGDAEAVDLLRMINDIIASTPGFNKMTNPQRTAAYDAFLINGGLIAGIDANARETNDPALAALARDLALSSLAQFGFGAPTSGPSPQPALVSNPVTVSVHAATPPATQKSNPKGMLDGIYGGLSTALHFELGGALTSYVSKNYVTFYPDGKVYRRVPEGGLEGWNRAAAEADSPRLWGAYRQLDPGRWEIRWNQSERIDIVVREGKGLRYENDMVFPVASCEGLVLDGRFLLPGDVESDDPYSIRFDRSGRFVDDRVIGVVAYLDYANPHSSRTIAPGEGKYHIGRNTLYLEYDDGRRVPVEMHVHAEDLKANPIPGIYINGRPLVRVD